MRNLIKKLNGMRKTILVLLVSAIPVVSQAAEQTIFYHLDALGSPIAATDEGGNLLWREEYRPYGDKIQKDPASTINSRAFTGHPHDDTTGLTYAGARHYDPVVGRFYAVDPVAFTEKEPHSFNRYAYASNNPYRYLDPNGQWSTEAHNYFIERAFPQLGDSARAAIKEGSRAADSLLYQGGSSGHMHSMWGESGSLQQMEQKRGQFITQHAKEFERLYTQAVEARTKGLDQYAERLERQAWTEYGKALHPIMDSTSPVHNQQWNAGSDWRKHGEKSWWNNSQEGMGAARPYEQETVRRMQNPQEFMR